MGHAVNDRHKRPPRLSHSRWRRRAGREPMLLSRRRRETVATVDRGVVPGGQGGNMERFLGGSGGASCCSEGSVSWRWPAASPTRPFPTAPARSMRVCSRARGRCGSSTRRRAASAKPTRPRSRGAGRDRPGLPAPRARRVRPGPRVRQGRPGPGPRARPERRGRRGPRGRGSRRRPEPGPEGAGERDGELVRPRHRPGQLPRRNDPDRRRSRDPRASRRRGGNGPAHPLRARRSTRTSGSRRRLRRPRGCRTARTRSGRSSASRSARRAERRSRRPGGPRGPRGGYWERHRPKWDERISAGRRQMHGCQHHASASNHA